MPVQSDISHDEVRMLALSIGVRPAARKLGLKEKTVLHWSHSEGWFDQPEPKPLPPTMKAVSVASVIKPADALADILADDSRETKLSLSRYARRTAQHIAKVAEDAPAQALARSRNVADVAKVAQSVHAWDGPVQDPTIDIRFLSVRVQSAPTPVPE